MGTYTELYIGNYPAYSTKSQVDPIVMTIFRESDRRIFVRNVSDRNPYQWGHIEENGKVETVYEYTNTVENIIHRLDVLGFSLRCVIEKFEIGKNNEIERLKSYLDESEHSILSDVYASEQDLLEKSTFDDWLIAFNEIFIRYLPQQILTDKLSSEEKPLIRYILSP